MKQYTEGVAPNGESNIEHQRAKAIELYYQNPNTCRFCEKPIPIPANSKVAWIRRKKFCNPSCAASFTNKQSPKRKRRSEKPTEGLCISCKIVIQYKDRRPHKYCDSCRSIARGWHNRERYGGVVVMDDSKTKGELKSQMNGYYLFRSVVNKHASRAYKQAGKQDCCVVCGYHDIQICHIKAVSKFPDTATLAEIDHPDNLVGLCPNHHYEFDKGQLELPNIGRGNRI